MLEELTQSSEKLVGAKQSKRALTSGRARKLFLAEDADPRVTDPLAQLAGEMGVEVVRIPTMRELGSACSIAVGAAVAVIL